MRVERYDMGELLVNEMDKEEQPELREVRRSDGSLESTTMYIRGVKQGVSRTFNDQGEVVAGAIFEQDELVAEGITLKDGTKEGPWREFWPNGQIRAEGMYESGLREGKWTFYRIAGEKEQEGKYRQGRFTGRGHGGTLEERFTEKKIIPRASWMASFWNWTLRGMFW